MDLQLLLTLYESMLEARRIDELEEELTNRGEAFFFVAGSGHEGSAVLAPLLTEADWLHCHYRDKALMLARGIPAAMFFRSLLCRDGSHSAGRQMSAHMSDPARHLLSLTGPAGNSALQAAGVAAQVKDGPGRPIVLASLGDGMTQQGEVLEAIAEAVRWQLPVLFFIEDNRYAISTPTARRTFYSLPDSEPDRFYGLAIERIDGRDVVAAWPRLAAVVGRMREERRPAIVLFQVERLTNHTNADDQSVYRSPAEVEAARAAGDPVAILARHLAGAGGLPAAELEAVRRRVEARLEAAVQEARLAPDPQPAFDAKRELAPALTAASREYRGAAAVEERTLTMLEAMREVLRRRLRDDSRVTLYGEDIEDPKGDVFGLTRGLTREFPAQVRNSPLSESTIVGVAVGRALAGGRPVAFLQFADFLPIAYNQILSELGSMHWRTAGAWQAPVIVMATCGGYRPGLGPFHAQTLESIAAHTPGVDVFMPATAADAAGLLNAAFESGRPTLFFYPKACLNDRANATSADVDRQFVPIGRARVARQGEDLTIASWGGTVGLCQKAADALEGAGVRTEILDLRSLSPWDRTAVLASARKTRRLLVVHEDNLTCGLGAELLAAVAEESHLPVQLRRVARPDTFIPCNFANQLEVLPSFRRILGAACDMLELDLDWELPPAEAADLFVLDAIGSSPADESVTIIRLHAIAGAPIAAGDLVAEMEADKAVVDLACPVSGVVARLHAREGDTLKVGAPVITVQTAGSSAARKPLTQERPGTPVLRRRAAPQRQAAGARPGAPGAVTISRVYSASGSRRVGNDEIVAAFPEFTPEAVVRRTGIETRSWAGQGETVLSLAARAARAALEGEGLAIGQIDAVVCSTGTPPRVTPSLACLLLHQLTAGTAHAEIPAHDINAACSGYLYALRTAYDHIQSRPGDRVLVVTSEVLSPLLDPHDFDTVIIFGDAASATIVSGQARAGTARARLHRPALSARGEDGRILSVPFPGCGEHVRMDGRKVFAEAVRRMIAMLERACAEAGIQTADLDIVVPHQANARILDAIRTRLRLPPERVFNNIRSHGNTSSSSIPLCLTELLDSGQAGRRLGLCAFGGGFTYGAAILETL